MAPADYNCYCSPGVSGLPIQKLIEYQKEVLVRKIIHRASREAQATPPLPHPTPHPARLLRAQKRGFSQVPFGSKGEPRCFRAVFPAVSRFHGAHPAPLLYPWGSHRPDPAAFGWGASAGGHLHGKKGPGTSPQLALPPADCSSRPAKLFLLCPGWWAADGGSLGSPSQTCPCRTTSSPEKKDGGFWEKLLTHRGPSLPHGCLWVCVSPTEPGDRSRQACRCCACCMMEEVFKPRDPGSRAPPAPYSLCSRSRSKRCGSWVLSLLLSSIPSIDLVCS